jgi:hypothetical protein
LLYFTPTLLLLYCRRGGPQRQKTSSSCFAVLYFYFTPTVLQAGRAAAAKDISKGEVAKDDTKQKVLCVSKASSKASSKAGSKEKKGELAQDDTKHKVLTPTYFYFALLYSYFTTDGRESVPER